MSYILDRDRLIARKKLLPGDAKLSPIFKRVAAGKMQFAGVVPPDKLATDHAAYQFILDTLRVCGIAFDPPYPFLRPR